MKMAEVDDDDDFDLPPARPGLVHSELSDARRKRDAARRAEAFTLLLGGFSYEQVGERLDISHNTVRKMLEVSLRQQPRGGVEDQRRIENARLDKAQSGIWTEVLKGDQKAIATFLRISERRSRLNGLDAPLKVDMAISIRNEMEQALSSLEQMVFGEVIEGEVVSEEFSDDYSIDDDDEG